MEWDLLLQSVNAVCLAWHWRVVKRCDTADLMFVRVPKALSRAGKWPCHGLRDLKKVKNCLHGDPTKDGSTWAAKSAAAAIDEFALLQPYRYHITATEIFCKLSRCKKLGSTCLFAIFLPQPAAWSSGDGILAAGKGNHIQWHIPTKSNLHSLAKVGELAICAWVSH